MNDNDELKARSIELAERALRLKDRAIGNPTKEALHAAANELIMLDNQSRFYDAQSILEKYNMWHEDQRSLAHEINLAARTLNNAPRLEITSALQNLEVWAYSYTNSSSSEVAKMGQELNSKLDRLNNAPNAQEKKDALNYIMTLIEAILEHIASDNNQVGSNANRGNTVINLRAIRDSMLVARELAYDEDELLANYKQEGEVISSLSIARHTLDELYKAAESS